MYGTNLVPMLYKNIKIITSIVIRVEPTTNTKFKKVNV